MEFLAGGGELALALISCGATAFLWMWLTSIYFLGSCLWQQWTSPPIQRRQLPSRVPTPRR